MIKKTFDTELTPDELHLAAPIIDEAYARGVTYIINVGTSLIESFNCIQLARQYAPIHAAVGIHPNDCTQTWHTDFLKIKSFVNEHKKNKIVGIGETGLDRHYPDTNIDRQKDAFRAHIDLALEKNLGLIVHTRDARDETLRALEEYKRQISRGIIHCFSEDQEFANEVIAMGFVIGWVASSPIRKMNICAKSPAPCRLIKLSSKPMHPSCRRNQCAANKTIQPKFVPLPNILPSSAGYH